MNSVKAYLSSVGFLLNDDSQVQIISGKEEAVNAWIAANYMEKNFNGIENEHKTKGIIDLGGGSTQVIFVPERNASFCLF